MNSLDSVCFSGRCSVRPVWSRAAAAILALASAPIASAALPFADDFNTDFIPVPVLGFSRTYEGVPFTFSCPATGDGADMVWVNASGRDLSGAVNVLSFFPNPATTERLAITRTDGGDFIFTGIYINNRPGSPGTGETATVAGYRDGSLVGTAQTVSPGNAVTLTFPGLVVDEVRISSADFDNFNFDNFSGEASAPNAPSALGPDTRTGMEDTLISGNVLSNDSDPDDVLAVASFQMAGAATVFTAGQSIGVIGSGSFTLRPDGSYTFNPSPNWNGSLPQITYTTNTGASSTLDITVTAVDDASSLQADTKTTDQGTPATGNVLSNDSDVDDVLTVASFRVAGDATVHTAGQTATITGIGSFVLAPDGNYTLTPGPGWSGSVPQVTYTVNTGSSSTLDLTVTRVNRPPVAVDDYLTAPEDWLIEFYPSVLLANDSDPDGDMLSFQSDLSSGGGTLTTNGVSIVFYSNPGFTGMTSFDYRISDGSASAAARVHIYVGENSAPAVSDDGPFRGEMDMPLSIPFSSVLANDTDANNDTLTVFSVGNPSAGQVEIAGGHIVFTPPAGFRGPATFTYRAYDGKAGFATATVRVAVGMPPVVTSVSSPNGDRSHGIGETIVAAVTFDQPVTVDTTGGTPTLLLETGPATYTSGSGTSTLSFSHIVGEGDVSADLDYTSTSALALNGATIRGATGGNDAVLTLPVPGGAGSIGAQKNIAIDGIRPTAEVVVGDTALKAGESTVVTITFREAVTGFSLAAIAAGNGTVGNFSTEDNIAYTVTLTPSTGIEAADNVITVDITGVRDIAGNAGGGSAVSNRYAIDTRAPTISSISGGSSTIPPSSSSINESFVIFSEPVTGVSLDDLEILKTGTADHDSVIISAFEVPPGSGAGQNFWITFVGLKGTGAITPVLKAAGTGIRDVAGNLLADGGATGRTYHIDRDSPTITQVIVPEPHTFKNGENIDVTVVYDEPVRATGTPSIVMSLDHGGPLVATLASGNNSTSLTFRSTVGAGQADATGVTIHPAIELNGGTLRDAAGNTAATVLSDIPDTGGVLVDASPPVVSIPIPDQRLVISEGPAAIDLTQHFTDLGSSSLLFTITGNTDGGKATAALSGNILTLTAAANGVTDITIRADDGHGGTVTDTFNVAVGTRVPGVLQVDATGTLNIQTGLFDMTVNVANTTARRIKGFRLHLDFSAHLAAHPSLRLSNATSTTAPGIAYVDYPFPVEVDAVIPLRLSFHTVTRRFPAPFTPVLTVETLAVSQLPDTDGNGVPARMISMPDQSKVIEFPSVAGKWYRIRYSQDLQHWQDCPVPLQAGANRLQWIDSGPPFTDRHPSQVPQRFYIVNEIPE